MGTSKRLLFLAALPLQGQNKAKMGQSAQTPSRQKHAGCSGHSCVSKFGSLGNSFGRAYLGDGGDITHFLGPSGP